MKSYHMLNKDEIWEHYIKWKSHIKVNIAWFHLYGESSQSHRNRK